MQGSNAFGPFGRRRQSGFVGRGDASEPSQSGSLHLKLDKGPGVDLGCCCCCDWHYVDACEVGLFRRCHLQKKLLKYLSCGNIKKEILKGTAAVERSGASVTVWEVRGSNIGRDKILIYNIYSFNKLLSEWALVYISWFLFPKWGLHQHAANKEYPQRVILSKYLWKWIHP